MYRENGYYSKQVIRTKRNCQPTSYKITHKHPQKLATPHKTHMPLNQPHINLKKTVDPEKINQPCNSHKQTDLITNLSLI